MGIAVDGGKFVRINPHVNGPLVTVRLKTLNPLQKTAALSFCRFKGGRPHVLKTFTLSDLIPEETGFASIRLNIDCVSAHVWEIQAVSRGHEPEFWRIRTGWPLWPWLVFIPLLFVLAAFIFKIPSGIFDYGISGVFNKTHVNDAVSKEINTVRQPAAEETVMESGAGADADSLGVVQSEGSVQSGEGKEGEAAEGEMKADDGKAADGQMQIAEGGIQSAEARIQAESAVEFQESAVVYFAAESYVMDSDSKAKAEEFALQVPEGYELLIEGHCANYGTEKGRDELSWERASAVAACCSGAGPSIKIGDLHGYGSLYPVSRNEKEQNLNRRVKITAVKINTP